MNDENRNEPHGGSLVNLLVDDQRAAKLKEIVFNLPDITLNDRQLCDLELLATGAFSPLKGFMTRSDYESVLDRMRLQNDLLWPIPIYLDVGELQARGLEVGQAGLQQPSQGPDVHLTLDREIQHIAELALSRAIQETGATGGSVVVLVPSSGRILAMVSLPTFDPNERSSLDPEMLRNRAIADVYEPGSTLKVVAVAGALELQHGAQRRRHLLVLRLQGGEASKETARPHRLAAPLRKPTQRSRPRGGS